MDLNEIQQLADLVKKSDLHELEIERENIRLKIVNKGGVIATHVNDELRPVQQSCHSQIIREDKVEQLANSEESANCHIIKSPIIGTFYSAPSSDLPDFVAKNTSVDVHSTVCIIEAMKVMNEIQAEVKGIITEVLVKNGQPIEYGQPLFRVKKS